jgi:hypothetical protein
MVSSFFVLDLKMCAISMSCVPFHFMSMKVQKKKKKKEKEKKLIT